MTLCLVFFAKKFGEHKKRSYLCTRKRERVARLGYGVMVTLQILVLPFLVRVRVAQQREGKVLLFFIFVCF